MWLAPRSQNQGHCASFSRRSPSFFFLLIPFVLLRLRLRRQGHRIDQEVPLQVDPLIFSFGCVTWPCLMKVLEYNGSVTSQSHDEINHHRRLCHRDDQESPWRRRAGNRASPAFRAAGLIGSSSRACSHDGCSTLCVSCPHLVYSASNSNLIEMSRYLVSGGYLSKYFVHVAVFVPLRSPGTPNF